MQKHEPVYVGRWSERLTFSPAIRVGNMLFISGTTATDEQMEIVGVDDIAEQTRQIFRKWELLLESVGASFQDIVETTDYYIDSQDYNRTADVRREFFSPPYPAATGVQVAGLVRKGALIEIKGVAFLEP